jgi:hypothetical protein
LLAKLFSVLYTFFSKTQTMENEYEKEHQHVEQPYVNGSKEGDNTYTDDVEGLEMPERTLQRQLKNRHIAMISIGGVIGMYCHFVVKTIPAIFINKFSLKVLVSSLVQLNLLPTVVLLVCSWVML